MNSVRQSSSFIYCNWIAVIASHLVNCLLPQKCFKFKFYITVLMFYKWCTSCLCIICPTLVIKAQSLNFILAIEFSLGRRNAGRGVPSARWGRGEDCLLWLCIRLRTFWAALHSNLSYLLCVLRDLHADSPVGGSTRRPDCSVLPQDEERVSSWTGSIYRFSPLSSFDLLLCSLDLGRNFWSTAGR